MKTLSKAATKTFLRLVAGLEPGQAKKVDNAAGAFMAVHVDFLRRIQDHGATVEFYAVAHRYEQNGDLVPDPDVEFCVVRPGGIGAVLVYPVAVDTGLVYRQYVYFDAVGAWPIRIDKARQQALAVFCGTWLKNIAQQQEV